MIRSSAYSAAHQRTVCSPITIDNVAWNSRKIPLSHSRHITGRYSPGPGQEAIPFESLLERSAIEALLLLPFAEEVRAQPVTISYSVSRAKRTYTPDIFVRLKHVPPTLSALGWENSTLIEVKPVSVALRQATRIRFKLRIAELATHLPGICLTEDGIRLVANLAKKEAG